VSLIAGVTGTVTGKTLDQVHVAIGGITLAVAAPLPTLSQLTLGNKTTLYTHLIVREDDLSLFGFTTTEERDLFARLIGVSGVGARLGLALLSTHSPEALCRAIISEDLDRLTRTPGVGKKLAQRLVLELKAPLTKFMAGLPATLDSSGTPVVDESTAALVRESDVIDALTGLGYSAGEVQIALRSVSNASSMSLDELIVKVLRLLAR
jgi:holliday junction DNA helicase RuvA